MESKPNTGVFKINTEKVQIALCRKSFLSASFEVLHLEVDDLLPALAPMAHHLARQSITKIQRIRDGMSSSCVNSKPSKDQASHVALLGHRDQAVRNTTFGNQTYYQITLKMYKVFVSS